MRPNLVARSYAETLLALAQRNGGLPTVRDFARALEELAALLDAEPRIREFLESPRAGTEDKQRVVRTALHGRTPDLFVRFVLVVIGKRRAPLLRQIAAAYHLQVDELLGQVRARVTLAAEADPALQREIVDALEARLGKTVLAGFGVDPALLGGVVVHVADQVLDGSVRHRLEALRGRLMQVRVPQPATA